MNDEYHALNMNIGMSAYIPTNHQSITSEHGSCSMIISAAGRSGMQSQYLVVVYDYRCCRHVLDVLTTISRSSPPLSRSSSSMSSPPSSERFKNNKVNTLRKAYQGVPTCVGSKVGRIRSTVEVAGEAVKLTHQLIRCSQKAPGS